MDGYPSQAIQRCSIFPTHNNLDWLYLVPWNGERLKKNQLILGLVMLAALVALVVWGRDRIHFDFAVFRDQLALADWRRILIALGCIYLCYVFRSVRWALLLRPNQKVPPLSLLGTQVIGFTAVALIGRVADPVRPYLVARKTGLPLSLQIAVYIVERMFDLGSMALIFSTVLLTTHETLPHPELLMRVAKGGLMATAAMAVFTIGVRMAGGGDRRFHGEEPGHLFGQTRPLRRTQDSRLPCRS